MLWAALLSPEQLEPLGGGRYRYSVSPLQLFQLRIMPTVEIQVEQPSRLEMRSLQCNLEGCPGSTTIFSSP